MISTAPHRTRQSFRHEAFLWRDMEEFSSGLVPFIEEGVAAGEPVMVALIREHASVLRNALGDLAYRVRFVDMREIGSNPARIIPAWQQFLDAYASEGKPVRGVGEPIWTGRRPAELVECQLHEALLNVAVDPEIPFWLVCPYNAEGLGRSVVEEAHRSHPAILETDAYRGSGIYRGREHADSLFSTALPDLGPPAAALRTSQRGVSDVFAFVTLHAYSAGIWSDRAANLATAARRLVASSLHRGAPFAIVRVWDCPDELICEVADGSIVTDLLAGRRRPQDSERDSLWSANQMCDLVQVRSGRAGTFVRMHAWK